MKRPIKFKDVAEGQTFFCNGLTAIKKTSRTARLAGPVGQGRVFYWGQTENVAIEV